MRSKESGFTFRLGRFFLYLLSLPFQFCVNLRNKAFDQGWLAQYQAPVPVVMSIGNIVAGGTGKTPMTLLVAQTFAGEFVVAVCSRGYRSPAEKLSSPLQLSKGEGPIHPASYCGDESYLISQNVPSALAFVGKDRKKAANFAAKEGAKLLILDDGMQHRQLSRDLEVVLVDAKEPFGYHYFLPRGTLRESPNSLSRADLIVVTNVQDSTKYSELEFELSGYSTAPVVGVKLEVAKVMDLSGNQMDSLKDKKVGIFCGIAHPEYFEETVNQLGAEVVSRAFTADHVTLESSELQKFAIQAKEDGADFLVCTEKDRVKLSEDVETELPILWIRAELRILEGKENWEAFTDKVRKMVSVKS